VDEAVGAGAAVGGEEECLAWLSWHASRIAVRVCCVLPAMTDDRVVVGWLVGLVDGLWPYCGGLPGRRGPSRGVLYFLYIVTMSGDMLLFSILRCHGFF
jgi:hypothetical protein